jgi:hypothetical protein
MSVLRNAGLTNRVPPISAICTHRARVRPGRPLVVLLAGETGLRRTMAALTEGFPAVARPYGGSRWTSITPDHEDERDDASAVLTELAGCAFAHFACHRLTPTTRRREPPAAARPPDRPVHRGRPRRGPAAERAVAHLGPVRTVAARQPPARVLRGLCGWVLAPRVAGSVGSGAGRPRHGMIEPWKYSVAVSCCARPTQSAVAVSTGTSSDSRSIASSGRLRIQD